MTLHVEVRNGTGDWVEVGVLSELSIKSGSISDYSSGHREIYHFAHEGPRSRIYRSELGADVELGGERVTFTKGLAVVHTLDVANPVVEMTRQAENGTSYTMRFRHVDAG